MPLVVDLLLLDESPSAADCEGGRLTTAKAIFSEIERQLQDGSSHLRRKSAFGALVAKGASIRFVRCERHDRLTPNQVAAAALPDLSAWPGATTRSALQSSDERKHGDHDWASETGWAKKPQPLSQPMPEMTSPTTPTTAPLCKVVATASSASIPRIEGFPRGQGRSRSSNAGGQEGFFNSIFNWWPSCVATPLKREACTIVFSDQPEVVLGSCAPEPAGPHISREEALAAQHEAGLGGWPLCVPHAYVAFLEGRGAIANASGMVPRRQPGAPAMAAAQDPVVGIGTNVKERQDTVVFQKAAVEVDDTELVIIMSRTGATIATSGCQSSPISAMTPSTASTVDAPWTPTEMTLGNQPISRFVFPREQLYPVRLLANADEALPCFSPELPGRSVVNLPSGDISTVAPWPHVVEVNSRPHGTSRALVLLIALPCAPLASRLHDALTRIRRSHLTRSAADTSANARRSRGSSDNDDETLGAVRCELQINANLEITNGDQVTNCAAVVRRGILEACHIGNDRLVVCTLREGNSGPVALDPIQAPVPDATPPPTDVASPTLASTAQLSLDPPPLPAHSRNRNVADPGDHLASTKQPANCEDMAPLQTSSTSAQKSSVKHGEVDVVQKQPISINGNHPVAQQAAVASITRQSGDSASFPFDASDYPHAPVVEPVGAYAHSGTRNGNGDASLISSDISVSYAENAKGPLFHSDPTVATLPLSEESETLLQRRSGRRLTA